MRIDVNHPHASSLYGLLPRFFCIAAGSGRAVRKLAPFVIDSLFAPNDMSQRSVSNSPEWLSRLIQGVLGVLGLYAALRLLPRVLKSMTRRFVFGLIGEIFLVAIGLFLTRRATEGPQYNGTPRRRQSDTPEES